MGITIARVAGIKLELHTTFLWFFGILVLLIGLSEPDSLLPTLGLFFLLFASVLIHELCHAVTAMHRGYRVKRILLSPIGGIAEMTELPSKPIDEFVITIAGPAFNFLVLFACAFLAALVPGLFPDNLSALANRPELLETLLIDYPLFGLAYLNLMLGAFNLFVPALPLDGGRILRSLLATPLGFARATRYVTYLSYVMSALLVLVGIFGNLWLVIIGAIVFLAAKSENQMVQIRETLGNQPVGTLLRPVPPLVPAEWMLDQAFDEMNKTNSSGLAVNLGNDIGLVDLGLLRQTPKTDWFGRTLGETAVKIPKIAPDTPAHKALLQLNQFGLPFLCVGDTERILGIVTLADIQQRYEIRKTGN